MIIRIKCPAKINLTLEVVGKRDDGFHNIKSIMQLISLYDYLDISVAESDKTEIYLGGNSTEIPYNSSNLVYKATEAYLNKINKTARVEITIEKNIPVAAGLAGGSTDGAGTIFGLNELFERPIPKYELHNLCAQLGSDLNVCLEGGTLLATSRGECIRRLKTVNMPVTLIKPKSLGISAKEAYTKYAQKEFKPQNNMTEKMINALEIGEDIKPYLYNDLEYAIFDDYKELQFIKSKLPNSIMSGSGSTYFILEDLKNIEFPDEYEVICGAEFIPNGVGIAELAS